MSISAKRSRRGFLRGLSVFAAVLLVIGAALLGWLWRELAQYEANTPESSVRRYLEQVRQEKWDLIWEDSGFQPTPVADREDYIDYLRQKYQKLPKDYTLVRVSGENQTYAIVSGEQEIARLELLEAPAGSGRKWKVRTVVEPVLPVEILSPEFVTVSVNGLELDGQYRVGEQPAPGYEELPEGVNAPQWITYRVEGLLAPPELTVSGPEGTQCGVTSLKEEKDRQTASVTVAPPKDAEEGYWKLAEEAAKTYAAFITSDAQRQDLNQYLLQGTPFYKAIQEFYNGWYIEHTSYSYENLVREEITMAGENAFSASLSFDYLIYRGYKEYRYPSSYRLDFIQTPQGWKLVQLTVR